MSPSWDQVPGHQDEIGISVVPIDQTDAGGEALSRTGVVKPAIARKRNADPLPE